MIKKLFSIILCTAMLFSMLPAGSVLAAEDEVKIIDSSSMELASNAGIALSSAYSKSGSFTLHWTGSDLKRTISLELQKSVPSEGGYLEFWLYSSNKLTSSFGLGLIADNKATACVDYYETLIDASFKGWYLISIPMSDLKAVHSPGGFDSITRLELWPSYGGYAIDASSDFYFDNFYVRQTQSAVTKIDTDYTIFDLSNKDKYADYGKADYLTVSGNRGYKEFQDAEGKAHSGLWWSDVASGGLNFGQRTDKAGTAQALPITDFSGYNTLTMDIYSENASGDTPQLILRSEGTEDDLKNDYFYEYITIDWTGWKTVNVRMGSMQKGQAPRGLDDICNIEFWMNNSVPEQQTDIYIKNISLCNIDYSLLWTEPQYIEDAPKTENYYDFAAKIKEIHGNSHPRLLITSDELEYIKKNYKTDEFLNAAVPSFLSTCEGYFDAAETPSDTSGTANRAASLALCYLLTDEARYMDAAMQKLMLVTRDCVTWNPLGSDLSIGDTSRYVAIAYDLLYNDMTESERMMVRNAMILYALAPKRTNLLNQGGASIQDTNWNAVINGGIGMCAMAIADTEGYEEAANQYLNRIPNALEYLFSHYGPDGSCFEGPDYLNYTMSSFLPYENALYNSIGREDFDGVTTLKKFGLENLGEYTIQMHGNTKASFNYYDGQPRGCWNSGDFFLAEYFNEPKYAGLVYEAKAGTMYNILMYTPNEAYKNWRSEMDLDYVSYGEAQVGAMRTDHGSGSQGFYVGYKGNNGNIATHGKLDAGTFVLEALGTRWVEQLDSDNYNAVGMFGINRYKYYRNRAEGNNTLVIGPGVSQGTNKEGDTQVGYQNDPLVDDVLVDQKNRSVAPIEKVSELNNKNASYAIVNLTDAYSATASSVRRGFGLINGRNAYLLQDEITTIGKQTVYSFMHTRAEAEISPDGQSAVLTRNGKKMQLRLISNCEAKLELVDAVRLSTSPDVAAIENKPVRKLQISADVNGSASIAVLLTPYNENPDLEYKLDDIVPLDSWEEFMQPPVALTGIYLDGVMLQNYEEGKTGYTLKEDSVGLVTATADSGIGVSVAQAEEVGDTAIITARQGNQTTNYYITFSRDTQDSLDAWDSYPVKGYLYSTNLAGIPNMFDGDISTEWANEGSQWVAFDLGKPKPVSEVQIYWKNNDKRVETFDISVSNDGESWTKVWEGDSVLSSDIVPYSFEEVNARYVKVEGYKNTVNNWTSICELRISFSGSCFDDLDGYWAKDAIEDMGKVGIVEGVSDRIYDPEATLTRAEYLTMLCRAFGLSEGEYTGTIVDVGANDWFMPYVESAKGLGVIPAQMLDGGYRPNQNITREEMAALSICFYEHFNSAVTPTSLDKFTDKGSISPWAYSYVEKALALRLITGVTETELEPYGNATRAQAAAILKRIYIKIS